MTAHRDLKRVIRERQGKTGESYTAARAHVLRERAALLGATAEAPAASEPIASDAVVLKVNSRSARVRILGEIGEITFRSQDIWNILPGQLVTLMIAKRWIWKGDEYASGAIENPRIAIDKLDLTPLPLQGGDLENLREGYEPYRKPDPYAPLWRALTAHPRRSFEMDPIAWGEFPGTSIEENLTCEAAELAGAGDYEGARELLMEALATDLRCLDAHAHLGNLEFDHSPKQAIIHYEVGVRIGELSLPAGFDGVLLWSHIENRPFLRCLHGYALCLWRLGRRQEAQEAFERILTLNPNDNQGVRFCWEDIRRGRSWADMQEQEAQA
jgi:tetratricopeptide (TPR) repeat protein